MKARVPFYIGQTQADSRKRATAVSLLLFERALWEQFGWGAERLRRFRHMLDRVITEVTQWEHKNKRNKTWQDEIDYWAETNGLEIPTAAKYTLVIEGGCIAYRDQRYLLIMNLLAVRHLGVGFDRLKKFLRSYAEISGLYSGGRATYSSKELKQWADEHGVHYPGCPADLRRCRLDTGEI